MSLFNSLIPAFRRSPAVTSATSSKDLGPTIRPAYEVRETQDAYGLTVYLPGVAKDGLEFTVEEGRLRVAGRRAWKRPEGWTLRHRESSDANYELVLTHENTVDFDKVHAELRDGVLRASLPKHEGVKPRRIAIS